MKLWGNVGKGCYVTKLNMDRSLYVTTCRTILLGIWSYWNTIFFSLCVFFPLIEVTERMLEPNGLYMGEAGVCHRMIRQLIALCDHLGVGCQAQGYLGSVLKVSWHLPMLLQHHPLFCLHQGLNPPLLSQVPIRLSYHGPFTSSFFF